jgi:hypothetical protein
MHLNIAYKPIVLIQNQLLGRTFMLNTSTAAGNLAKNQFIWASTCSARTRLCKYQCFKGWPDNDVSWPYSATHFHNAETLTMVSIHLILFGGL